MRHSYTMKRRLLLNLTGRMPDHPLKQSKEETCECLKLLSDEDFGHNMKAWEKWLSSKSTNEIDELYYNKIELPKQLIMLKILEKYAKKYEEEENEE
jgi:hypothetical protein